MNKNDEMILCVPTALFHKLGYFQGFQANLERYMPLLLDPANALYVRRGDAEEDPSYKQLIPYCLFRTPDGQLFHYRRAGSGGEDRLLGKRSIGVGGHISASDTGGETLYETAMKREIAEEVTLAADYTQRCVGLINDDDTPVGKVHLGVVHLFELETPQLSSKEDALAASGFDFPNKLLEDKDNFETWSQICLAHLYPHG